MTTRRKTGGRQLGTPNKVTTFFKEAVRIAYDEIGGHTAFAAWARENPTEYYRIAARLIPTEITAREGNGVTVIIQRDAGGAIVCNDGMLLMDTEHDGALVLPVHSERMD